MQPWQDGIASQSMYHHWEWETWAAPTSSMGQTFWIFVLWSKSVHEYSGLKCK
jgi:hypothetical protein